MRKTQVPYRGSDREKEYKRQYYREFKKNKVVTKRIDLYIETDSDIINWLAAEKEPFATLAKRLLRIEINKEVNNER